MKTLVYGLDTRNEANHALIISNRYVQYLDVNTPIWVDEEANLAKTENVIGNVVLYQTNEKGKVKRIEVSGHFILEIAKQINDLISADTEPEHPEY